MSELKDIWLNQKFNGKECTFGDDRHMTNLILSKGYNVLFTHKAVCYTETPVSLKRWILQQIRWGKSFIRELFLNIQWFHKQNIWLAYDLTFLSIYSLFLLVLLVITLFTFDIYMILFFMYGIVFVSGIRGLYASILNNDYRYLYLSFYGVLYVFILLPLKLWSIMTLNEKTWGTSTRKHVNDKIDINMLPVIIWNILFFLGIVLNIIFDYDTVKEKLFLSLLSGFVLFCFVFIFVVCIYKIFNKYIIRNPLITV